MTKRALTVLVLGAVLAGLAGHPGAAQTSPLKSIDVYGTERITAEQAREKLGRDIEAAAAAFATGDFDDFADRYLDISRRAKALGPFAFARLSLIQSFESGRPMYATIDVVEEADRARRMDFLPSPGGTFADPDGVLALWSEYQAKGDELVRNGELDGNARRCPAFHCVYGFEHPTLKPYLERLNAGAHKHRDALIHILHEDKNSENRARAAFVLAHTTDCATLVRTLVPSIRDPASGVRNNVMRVLSYVAREHPELPIPLDPVLKAIDYPETTDRNKALYILDGLADRPENRPRIAREAGPTRVKLLRLLQPNNHDPAWSILKKVSGQAYGDRDYAAWEAWLARSSSGDAAATVPSRECAP